MEVSAQERPEVERYQASHVKELRRALRCCEIDLRDYHFVDLGCGKGRALFIAALEGFEHCVGIELEPNLIRLCSQNIESFCQKTGIESTRFELVESNVLNYQVATPRNLFYLFNPFKRSLVARLLQQLESSPTPYQDLVLSMNPRSDSVFEANDYGCLQDFYHTNLNKTLRLYRRRIPDAFQP